MYRESSNVKYDFAGKVAVVTGASTGIGRAIATALGHAGAAVTIDHLGDQRRADEVVAEIETAGGRAMAFEADVSDPGAVKSMYAATAEAFGGVDFLINNASVEINRFVWSLGDDEWSHVLANSLDSVFFCSKYVLPYMIPRGGGKIVNISSIHDSVPRKGSSAYCVSKAGVLMLTEVLALELAPHNVQVNAVSPGVILTERTDPQYNRSEKYREGAKRVVRANPLKRAGVVEEVVAPTMYLCSDMSDYAVGTTIYVDGGYRHNVCPIEDGDALPHLEKLK